MKTWQFVLIAVVAGGLVFATVRADTTKDPRSEVAANLKAMGDAANDHDVERHVGFYAHDPQVTLISDGESIVGWEAIRDKQREWWNNGKTDVVYTVKAPPEVRVLAPNVVLTTLLMDGRRTLPSGEVRLGHFVVSSIWQKRTEGWRVVYSHESTTH